MRFPRSGGGSIFETPPPADQGKLSDQVKDISPGHGGVGPSEYPPVVSEMDRGVGSIRYPTVVSHMDPEVVTGRGNGEEQQQTLFGRVNAANENDDQKQASNGHKKPAARRGTRVPEDLPDQLRKDRSSSPGSAENAQRRTAATRWTSSWTTGQARQGRPPPRSTGKPPAGGGCARHRRKPDAGPLPRGNPLAASPGGTCDMKTSPDQQAGYDEGITK